MKTLTLFYISLAGWFITLILTVATALSYSYGQHNDLWFAKAAEVLGVLFSCVLIAVTMVVISTGIELNSKNKA